MALNISNYSHLATDPTTIRNFERAVAAYRMSRNPEDLNVRGNPYLREAARNFTVPRETFSDDELEVRD